MSSPLASGHPPTSLAASTPSHQGIAPLDPSEETSSARECREWQETVYDLLQDIRDPEKPESLSDLDVVRPELIQVRKLDYVVDPVLDWTMSSTDDDRDGPLTGLPEGDTSFEGQSSLTGGVANTISDFYEDEEEELESESEINDANLLRSMLRESENFDPTHILMRGESGYPPSNRPSNDDDEEDEDEKQCWVCFATENDDLTAVWVHPCRCRGTTKWVHHVCIQRWVDEKQKGNTSATVECPQCGTPYSIQLPPANFFVSLLDTTDKLVQKCCPIVAGGFCVGSLYWTCVTYGAVVLMQTVGHDEGLVLMERTDPLFLLVALPLVPVGLVLGKMARWEEPVRILFTY
eukprot:TCALIF_01819-PA protein Name:"Similar to march5 E3 ubiquitin-protein ligase MARCH5 (Xenopus laevis)" AED:0.39 eAED:0.39 QI:0/0.66/0.25/1/1/1/4/0/348